ncbi:hypothetical protein Glove_132g21 [Diversispora epigaea]|uniref:Uncharacterized protein n=1 Tax=Diversispora epigaea TaxID=1348612 RepID=A0A397J6T7_9GLOM|nr:hypothetical protein Glove_132g21 [Diversispora epigaea]
MQDNSENQSNQNSKNDANMPCKEMSLLEARPLSYIHPHEQDIFVELIAPVREESAENNDVTADDS